MILRSNRLCQLMLVVSVLYTVLYTAGGFHTESSSLSRQQPQTTILGSSTTDNRSRKSPRKIRPLLRSRETTNGVQQLLESSSLRAGGVQEDAASVLQEIEAVFAVGAEADAVLMGLAQLCHQIYLFKVVPHVVSDDPSLADLTPLAQRFESQQAIDMYRSLLKSCKYLPYAPDSRSGLEVAILGLMTLPHAKSAEEPSYVAPVVPAPSEPLLAPLQPRPPSSCR